MVDTPPKGIDDARAAGVRVEVLTGAGKHAALAEAAAVAEPDAGPDLPDYPRLEADALYGLAGDVVRELDPYTEAHPAGILGTFLAGFGNAIGRGSFRMADGARHGGNLFLALVGDTSLGRKGTAWDRVSEILREAEPEWYRDHIRGGLVSGEGIVHAVRDPSKSSPGRNGEKPDEGVPDKRLLAFESELSRVLRVGAREGNALTTLLRQAWETGDLRTLAKNSPEVATGAHVSLVAHVVPDEVRRYLKDTEIAGGLGNRFLWVCVKRSKILPDGGHVPEDRLRSLVDRTRGAIVRAKMTGELSRDEGATDLWREVYPSLTAGRPGILGAMTCRGHAQTLRLSILYALLDKSRVIREPHLRAAHAFWRYCEASVRYVFGDALGDDVAERILQFLRQRCRRGATRLEINREALRGHVPAARIRTALQSLEGCGLVHRRREPQSGPSPHRPAERWFAGAEEAKEADKAGYAHDFISGAERSRAEERVQDGETATQTTPCYACSDSVPGGHEGHHSLPSLSSRPGSGNTSRADEIMTDGSAIDETK
jgi:DNA-binding transcriptional ArsR family regulator